MKKILSILGAVSLTVATPLAVVACGGEKAKPVKQPKPDVKTPKPVKQPKPDVKTPKPVKQPTTVTKKDIEESIENDPDKDKNNLFKISVPSEILVENPQAVQESELKSIFSEEILKSGIKINNNITKKDFAIHICNVGTLDTIGQLMLENEPYDLTTYKFLKIVWETKNDKFGDKFKNKILINIVALPIAKTK